MIAGSIFIGFTLLVIAGALINLRKQIRKQIYQAKAMEKEQIKDAYKAGFAYRDTWQWEMDIDWDTHSTNENNEAFEQYYNETYKQE